MKNELFCDAVRDLWPSYAEGLTSQATSAAIEDHLKNCAQCRGLRNSALDRTKGSAAEAKEIDYLKTIRRKNRRKVGAGVSATVLFMGAILFLWIHLNAVLNVVEIVYSGDRSRALVIYDKDISGTSGEKSAFFVKEYNDLTDTVFNDMKLRWFGRIITHNTLNIVAKGPYRGSIWSPDGTMFVVNCGNGELTLDRLVSSSSPNIHYFIAGLLKQETLEQFGYTISEDSPGYEGIALTALQWNEDSKRILVNYVTIDTSNVKHSGYLWYDCYDNSIHGLMEN
jgi:hypothetical protein